jgi:hypothetical protein
VALAAERPTVPDNPAIDMPGYLKVSAEAAKHRASRRISEDDFLRMSREKGTIILDARSQEKYDLLHVRGAIHLNFSDITVESLRRTIPDKNTRILIYCNNNFENDERAFPTKLPTASLNLSTYIALYNYGYKNVYELAPLLDRTKSKIPFVSTEGKRGWRPAGIDSSASTKLTSHGRPIVDTIYLLRDSMRSNNARATKLR